MYFTLTFYCAHTRIQQQHRQLIHVDRSCATLVRYWYDNYDGRCLSIDWWESDFITTYFAVVRTIRQAEW